MTFRDAREFDPETYRGEAGLLGRLQAIMPASQPRTVELSSKPNGGTEYNPETSFSPQGGLYGRLLTLQAEQSRYRQTPLNTGAAPFTRQDPNFRQLSRVPVLPPSAVAPSDLPDDQPNPTGSLLAADLAAQPERSLSDRLQAFWDRPAPHGLVAVLKAGTSGIAQAVQGSVDATSTPSTEEGALRQNFGREVGPIGAFRAISLRAPMTPGRTGAFWRGIFNLLESRAASTAIAGTNPLSRKP
jgi:hypothetical protein